MSKTFLVLDFVCVVALPCQPYLDSVAWLFLVEESAFQVAESARLPAELAEPAFQVAYWQSLPLHLGLVCHSFASLVSISFGSPAFVGLEGLETECHRLLVGFVVVVLVLGMVHHIECLDFLDLF